MKQDREGEINDDVVAMRENATFELRRIDRSNCACPTATQTHQRFVIALTGAGFRSWWENRWADENY